MICRVPEEGVSSDSRDLSNYGQKQLNTLECGDVCLCMKSCLSQDEGHQACRRCTMQRVGANYTSRIRNLRPHLWKFESNYGAAQECKEVPEARAAESGGWPRALEGDEAKTRGSSDDLLTGDQTLYCS